MLSTNTTQPKPKAAQPQTSVLVSAGASSVLPHERDVDNDAGPRRVIVARPKTLDETRVALAKAYGEPRPRPERRLPVLTTQVMEERRRNKARLAAMAQKKVASTRGRKKKA